MQSFTRRALYLGAIAILFLGVGCQKNKPDGNNEIDREDVKNNKTGMIIEPALIVDNQEVNNGAVVIKEAVATAPSWIVIHADASGSPGAVIGEGLIAAGTQRNVSIEIDTAQATPRLYAMLHADLGIERTYEFPGADEPVVAAGKPVMRPFTAAVRKNTNE